MQALLECFSARISLSLTHLSSLSCPFICHVVHLEARGSFVVVTGRRRFPLTHQKENTPHTLIVILPSLSSCFLWFCVIILAPCLIEIKYVWLFPKINSILILISYIVHLCCYVILTNWKLKIQKKYIL